MTLQAKDRQALIKYRTKEANEAIKDVEILMEKGRLKPAVNRIYYRMFYILSALALKYEFKTSKHKGIISWFNQTFVKENKVDRNYGKVIRAAFDKRSDSDYGLFVEFEWEELERT